MRRRAVVLVIVMMTGQTGRQPQSENPFVGLWLEDLSRSTVHAGLHVQTATLQFVGIASSTRRGNSRGMPERMRKVR